MAEEEEMEVDLSKVKEEPEDDELQVVSVKLNPSYNPYSVIRDLRNANSQMLKTVTEKNELERSTENYLKNLEESVKHMAETGTFVPPLQPVQVGLMNPTLAQFSSNIELTLRKLSRTGLSEGSEEQEGNHLEEGAAAGLILLGREGKQSGCGSGTESESSFVTLPVPALSSTSSVGEYEVNSESDSYYSSPNFEHLIESLESDASFEEPPWNQSGEDLYSRSSGGDDVGTTGEKRKMEVYAWHLKGSFDHFVETGIYIPPPPPPMGFMHLAYHHYRTRSEAWLQRCSNSPTETERVVKTPYGEKMANHFAANGAKLLEVVEGASVYNRGDESGSSSHPPPPVLSAPLDLSPSSMNRNPDHLRRISESFEEPRDVENAMSSSPRPPSVLSAPLDLSPKSMNRIPDHLRRISESFEEPRDVEYAVSSSSTVLPIPSPVGAQSFVLESDDSDPAPLNLRRISESFEPDANADEPAGNQNEEEAPPPSSGEGAVGSTELDNHVEVIMLSESGKRYWCKCGKDYAHKSSLRRHMHSNGRGKIFGCKTCGSRYALHSSLKTHVKSKHAESNPDKFGCRICGTTFRSMTELAQHRYTAHHI